jgi:Tfp pilus assembly protein PilX
MRINQKGLILFIVLAVLVIAIILAGTILGIISNQSRITQHQSSRIRAYYAAKAGINLAWDKLRNESWSPGNFSLCNNQTLCDEYDPDIAYRVEVNLTAGGSGNWTISATSFYTNETR